MTMKLLLLGLGMQEIVFIALIVLLLFGGKKIPELMNGLGRGVKSFKDGMNGEEVRSGADAPERRQDATKEDGSGQ